MLNALKFSFNSKSSLWESEDRTSWPSVQARNSTPSCHIRPGTLPFGWIYGHDLSAPATYSPTFCISLECPTACGSGKLPCSPTCPVSPNVKLPFPMPFYFCLLFYSQM